MTTRTRATTPEAVAEDRSTSAGYRPELQGLRALAVVLVVAYHVWLGRVSGGVDVFFLITGFLITGQVYRAGLRGRFGFRAMWARMIKRLFPAALTVLLVTMAVSVALLPEARWWQTIREIVASALYVENWQLAADSVDYFAQHNTASVVQHYWSLSIQGQFYLLWPLLIALVAVLARTAGHRLRPWLLATLAVVFTTSLTYSVVLTATNQPLAYFHSATRVWEFALGGLLALTLHTLTLPRLLRILAGWLGVTALITCGLVLQVGSVFPGYAALWPTLAAALVILAGTTHSKAGADHLLASRPLEYLGNLAYALYLWHWPVLLCYLVARDRTEVGPRGGAVIVAIAVGLSILTYHLVEKPARDSQIGVHTRWGGYRFGVLLLVPVLLAAGGWQWLSTERANAYAESVNDADHPGAVARTPEFPQADEVDGKNVELVPSMVALPSDWSDISQNCVPSTRNAELNLCTTKTNGPPERRIVVVGESHSRQYLAALRPIAERRNWQITEMLRSACPFSTSSEVVRDSQGCVDWNAAAAKEIIKMRPDTVFTMASREVRVGFTEHTPPGFVEQWRKLERAGIPVIGVRDNPRYDFTPSDCVAAKGRDAPECGTRRADILAPQPPYERIPDVPSNVSFLDFSDYICMEDVCPPVIGNVLVYKDENHLSATYLSTMSSIVEKEITSAMNW
ncbi:MAG: acyltransferase family protein [Pseudonocardiaceae bacterium]|nr:acyltransferase family protein [Pseudonocardiaceae bacterium]